MGLWGTGGGRGRYGSISEKTDDCAVCADRAGSVLFVSTQHRVIEGFYPLPATARGEIAARRPTRGCCLLNSHHDRSPHSSLDAAHTRSILKRPFCAHNPAHRPSLVPPPSTPILPSHPLLAWCPPLCVAVFGARNPVKSGQVGAGGSPSGPILVWFCL